MSFVNITNVIVLDNPTAFSNQFQFEITFECLQELSDDLEWKVIYVGSAEDSKYDQVLEEVMVGPVPVGVNKFVLQAPSPSFDAIPTTDVLGVTVVLVTCSFMDHEFVRIGYYVNNEYADPIDPEQPLPNPLEPMKISRNILADQPRVTRFPIDWSGKDATGDADLPPSSSEADLTAGDEEEVDMNEEDSEEDEEDDEEGDDMAEEDLGDEDEEDMIEGIDPGHEIVDAINEDSMDVARMQTLLR